MKSRLWLSPAGSGKSNAVSCSVLILGRDIGCAVSWCDLCCTDLEL